MSLAKSKNVFSPNTDVEHRTQISTILSMDETTDLGLHLGMPTLTSRVTRDTFGHLCEKIDRKLAGWKDKYLSLAGRIALAKSTLSTLAYYSMQTAKIPRNLSDVAGDITIIVDGGSFILHEVSSTSRIQASKPSLERVMVLA